jgi:hypothetical protein
MEVHGGDGGGEFREEGFGRQGAHVSRLVSQPAPSQESVVDIITQFLLSAADSITANSTEMAMGSSQSVSLRQSVLPRANQHSCSWDVAR